MLSSVIMFAKRSHLQSFHCLGSNEDGNCLDRKAPALIDMSFQPILSYPYIYNVVHPYSYNAVHPYIYNVVHPHTLIYHTGWFFFTGTPLKSYSMENLGQVNLH